MLLSGRARSDEGMDGWLPPTGDVFFRVWQPAQAGNECVILARDHLHAYPTHLHDCVEIVWIHSGHVRITCRGRCYQLQPGDVCLLAPNELHGTEASSNEYCTFTLIHLPSDAYWRVASTRSPAGTPVAPEPFRILRSHRLNLRAFLEAFVNSRSAAERDGLATPLLEAIMFAPHSFATLRADMAFWHPAVVHARGMMTDRIDESINVDAMAAEVGLNPRYFISLFKDGIGLPPHQFQIAMRVERARCCLQSPDSAICEIAADAGFADQSHLNRHFKRSYGFTPGAFRRHLRFI